MVLTLVVTKVVSWACRWALQGEDVAEARKLAMMAATATDRARAMQSTSHSLLCTASGRWHGCIDHVAHVWRTMHRIANLDTRLPTKLVVVEWRGTKARTGPKTKAVAAKAAMASMLVAAMTVAAMGMAVTVMAETVMATAKLTAKVGRSDAAVLAAELLVAGQQSGASASAHSRYNRGRWRRSATQRSPRHLRTSHH